MEKLFFSRHHQNLTQEVHKHSSALFLLIPQSSHQKTTLFSAQNQRLNFTSCRGRGLNDDAVVGTHCPYGHSNFTVYRSDNSDSSSEASS